MNDLLDHTGDLRALCEAQRRQLDRLHAERETHLAQVEQAFRRRHNQQQARIDELERLVVILKKQIKESA